MRFAVCAIVWLLVLGCDPEFPDRSLVEGYRVLGVVAVPPDVGPEDTFTLSLIETDTPDIQYTWTACLAPLGSEFGFRCLDEVFEISLPYDSASPTIDLGPNGINYFAKLIDGFTQLAAKSPEFADAAMGENPDGESMDVSFAELQFNITSGPPNGRQVTTIKVMKVYFDDSARNRNPEILSFDVTTPTPVKGCDIVRFEYGVNETLFDDYTLVNGTELVEENIMTWYATAGTFTDDPSKDDKERNISTSQQSEMFLKLPETIGAETVQVWGILRDERGGTDFRTLTLPVVQ
ncbi:MAG: hypothetical protein ACPGQS_11770 [Bradymonadia bacterium]